MHQEPIHAGRPDERGPAPRVGAAEIDSEQRVSEPAEPFEEIVRMPRPTPQAGLANPVAVDRIGAEAPQLRIRQPLAGDGRDQDRYAERVLQAQTRPRIPRRKHHRHCQRNADQRLLLCQEEHLPRCVGAPFRDHLAVARIVLDADRAPRDMQAEAQRPNRDQNRHQHLAYRHAAGQERRRERAGAADDTHTKSPGRVDPAGVARAAPGEPGAAHDRRQADTDGNDDGQECERGHGTASPACARDFSTLAMKASVSRKIGISDRMMGAIAATMM